MVNIVHKLEKSVDTILCVYGVFLYLQGLYIAAFESVVLLRKAEEAS